MGQILAIVALAVFAVPILLMLYFLIKYVIDLIPRKVRDDCPACRHAEHDRSAGACPAPGCDCPLGKRPPEARAGAANRPRPTPPAAPKTPPEDRAFLRAKARRPPGHDPGPCRACGHSLVHHEPGSRDGCTWSRPGWRWERVHRDDDWATGWEDERRWDRGTPCGCPAYLDPEAP